MQFLQLQLKNNNEKILINIDKIISIYQIKGITNVYVGEVVYEVKEKYEEIVDALNHYYNLPKA